MVCRVTVMPSICQSGCTEPWTWKSYNLAQDLTKARDYEFPLVSFRESKSIEGTLIQSACQVKPPSELCRLFSETSSRSITLAKPVSASLRMTVRLVIPEECQSVIFSKLNYIWRLTITSKRTTATRPRITFVAGVEVLEGSIER